MSKEDINYEPEIIFVPLHWYYSLLDHKQKRPDYKRITSMAILGDLCLSVPKHEWLTLFNETPQRIRKALEVLKKLDIITFSVFQNYFEISINTTAQILPFKKAI